MFIPIWFFVFVVILVSVVATISSLLDHAQKFGAMEAFQAFLGCCFFGALGVGIVFVSWII